MESILGRLNWLYNQALERRRTAHQEREESLSFYDQCQWLTQMRAVNAALNILAAGVIALGSKRGPLGRASLQNCVRKLPKSALLYIIPVC